MKYNDKIYQLIENIVYSIFNCDIPLNDPKDTTERIINLINNNLEEQAVLFKLPCSIGDTVFIYADFTKNIEPYTVDEIHIGSCYAIQFDCSLYIGDDELIDSTEFELDDIGKSVFLTREESEKVLDGQGEEYE